MNFDNKNPKNQSVIGNLANYNTPKTPNKRRLVGFIISGLLVLAAGAVYIFGIYLPNKPQNVYKTGLGRTGKTMNKLVYAATEKETLDKLKNTELTGSFEASGGGYTYSGSINSKYDTEQTDTTSDFKIKNPEMPEQKIDIKFLRDQPAGNEFPDMFLQVTGLSTFDIASYFYPQLKDYDGKWIAISADYLKTLVPAGGDAPKQENFTYEDGAQLTRIISDHTKEYVLTGNSQKSILVLKSFVGEEKLSNGITANRYTVGLSKDNTRKFCEAIYAAVLSADAYKRLPGADTSNVEKDKEEAIKSCKTSTENIDENDTFDLWVDKKQKLVHKVRFADKQDKSTYWEVGQSYKKGDQLPLFVVIHSENGSGFLGKYHGELIIDVNVKSGLSTGRLNFEAGENESKLTAKASFEMKPTTNDVKIERPQDTIPIQEILNKLGFSYPGVNNFSPLGGLEPTGGKDEERKNDIVRLQYYLEFAAANNNGFYPTLAQMNDESWRAANIQDLDKEVFKDPDGTLYALASSSSASQYGYNPSGCDSGRCRSYNLEATLSDGSKYTMQALN